MIFLYDLYVHYDDSGTRMAFHRYNREDYYIGMVAEYIKDTFISDKNPEKILMPRYRNLLTLDYFCKARIF
jgi:hypothetical protein